MKERNPLVTIFIVTYNSGKFIEEALDSAKAQIYSNIELIISDDCSTDNTIALCKQWLEVNSDRFVRTKLLTVLKNTGVSANGNRALKVAKGEWMKCLAGDDILMEDCVSSYMDYISSTSCRFIFGLPSVLINPEDRHAKQQMENYYHNSKPFFNLSAANQFKFLLVNGIPVSPPTLFFHRTTLIQLKGFDERYACEDLPLYLQATSNGYKLGLLDKQTVYYRIHDKQLSHTETNELVHKGWFYEQVKIKKEYFTFEFVLRHPLISLEYQIQKISKYIILKTGNKKEGSPLLSYLSTLKSKIRFSYISKVKM